MLTETVTVVIVLGEERCWLAVYDTLSTARCVNGRQSWAPQEAQSIGAVDGLA